jgi:hypothetical protein
VAELQGIETMSPTMKVFVQIIRDYTRDHPELNRLIAGQETGNRMIAWCVLDAVSRFNGTPQITGFTLDELLQRQQQHLMVRLTVETILESVGLLQTRNHINYSNGGINVGVNDKTPMIMNWLQYYKSYTQQLLQRVKVAINIESILGAGNVGVHSELWAVNATYLAY